MRVIALYTAAVPGDRPGFWRWFTSDVVGRAARTPGVRGVVARCVVPEPQGLPAPMRAGAGGSGRPWDVVLQADCDRDASLPLELGDRPGAVAAYHVTPMLAKGWPVGDVASPPQPLTMLIELTSLPGMTREQLRRRWAKHEPLAVRTHTGVSRYERNIVEATLTEGAPPIDGFGDFSFPTLDDARHRFLAGPAEIATIQADIKDFVAAARFSYLTDFHKPA